MILDTEIAALRDIALAPHPHDDHPLAYYIRDAIADRSCDLPLQIEPNPFFPNPIPAHPLAIAALDDLMRRLFSDTFDFAPDELRYRELITELALAYSLCPMHFCDYAICFDDEDAECAAIRHIHPAHDT